jgi:hypothetical protein
LGGGARKRRAGAALSAFSAGVTATGGGFGA